MIVISTTQSNEMVLTLGDIKTINEPYYTFKLVNKTNFDEYIFSPDNNSTSPYYDAFTLSVGTISTLTGSNVTLNLNTGEYNYFVYEKSTPYDLLITTSDRVVEVGIMNVEGTQSDFISFTASDDDTIISFNEL